MFTYEYSKGRGWTKVWIDKINAHPMISNDRTCFYDQQKFEVLEEYIQEKHDSELYKLMSSIQTDFWEEQFTEKLAVDIFNRLDKLEVKYKQIILERKMNDIEKDF